MTRTQAFQAIRRSKKRAKYGDRKALQEYARAERALLASNELSK